jgi:uncharacterized membrane protein YhiD involved in acid resistance
VTRVLDVGRRIVVIATLVVWTTVVLAAQTPPAARPTPTPTPAPAPVPVPVPVSQEQGLQSDELLGDIRAGLADAAVRLPIAALLGAALALRPRRASSPRRDPAVIETQIVLAIVGALIMLVVGQSLARAFGIAGAANLIRYRAKIEDPKDAVVMLSTLAVGLAAGVGLFGLAAAGTLFLVATLWIIEGFETHVRTFLLSVKLGEGTSTKRAAVERLLQRARTAFELRTTGDDELAYLVSTGASFKTEELTAALAALAPKEKPQIEWKEEKKARPLEKDEDDD